MCLSHALIVLWSLGLVANGYPVAEMLKANGDSGFEWNEAAAQMMEDFLMKFEERPNLNFASSDTIRLVKGKNILRDEGPPQILFNFSTLHKHELILQDELNLQMPSISQQDDSSLIMFSLKLTDLFTGRMIIHQPLRVTPSGWYKIPLRLWTRQWLTSPTPNTGVVVVLYENGGPVNMVRPHFKKQSSFGVPFLLLHCTKKFRMPFSGFFVKNNAIVDLDPESVTTNTSLEHTRTARAVNNTSSCSNIVVNMMVVVDPAYGVLISPGNYTTKKCLGRCPPSANPVNHSSKCNTTLHDCCVPSKTAHFPFMFRDDFGNIALQILTNAVVKECSCLSSLLKPSDSSRK